MTARFPEPAHHLPRDSHADRARLFRFAGILLLIAGAGHVMQGIAALANQEYFTVRTEYLFELNMTVWGWTHLVGGLLMVLAGTGVLLRWPIARPLAVALACVSILLAFVWLPFNLFGAMVIVVLDVLVIGAVSAPATSTATTEPAERSDRDAARAVVGQRRHRRHGGGPQLARAWVLRPRPRPRRRASSSSRQMSPSRLAPRLSALPLSRCATWVSVSDVASTVATVVDLRERRVHAR